MYSIYFLFRNFWVSDSLTDFLASAVDAAKKAGEVCYCKVPYFVVPSSNICSLSSSFILVRLINLMFQVIRKGFYQTKHVEHKGEVSVFLKRVL